MTEARPEGAPDLEIVGRATCEELTFGELPEVRTWVTGDAVGFGGQEREHLPAECRPGRRYRGATIWAGFVALLGRPRRD
jgi:hypothetical protein